MFGVDGFNADDSAALKNQGSYRRIPQSIRVQVNREFEEFVSGHVLAKQSFAFETTLRTDITFKQAAEAKAQGFTTALKYIAAGGLDQHLDD